MVSRPRAGEDASLSLRAIIAGVGCPLGCPWVDPCRLSVRGRLTSPQGWLLHVRLVEVRGREGVGIY